MSNKSKGYLYRGGILLLVILGVIVILMRQANYGVGLVVDSLTHTSTAESLLRGEGFITAWNSRPQQGQPPLYALWLSLFTTLDMTDRYSIFGYTGYAGAVVFGLTILASVVWIASKVKSRVVVIIGGGICAFSPFLGDLFSLALTETLFLLVTVLSLLTLDKFLTSDKRSILILAATFSALSWLTRHIGVTVVISSVLVLMIRNGPTFRQKLNSVVVYSSIAILPSSLWMLRNYIVLGQLSERRWATGFGWITSLNLASSEITKWLVGTTGLDYLNRLSRIFGIDVASLRIMFLGSIAASVVFGLTYLYRKGIRIDARGLVVPVLFISVYSVALTTSLILTDIDIDMRYLSPIYVPIVVAAMIILGRCYTYATSGSRSMGLSSSGRIYTRDNRLQFIIVAGLFLHLILVISSSHSQIQLWRKQGFGYSSKPWTDSETIHYLRSNPISGQIYSNQARAVYTQANPPDGVEVHFNQLQAELPDEARYWADSAHAQNLEMYVIWFHGWRPFIQTQYDFVQLIYSQDLEIVGILEDGIVLKAPHNLAASRSIVDRESAEDSVIETVLDDTRLVTNSEFDIYLSSKSGRLIYVSSSCSDTNTEDKFFLHIFPTHRTDILKHRKASNFNNHDFKFDREGFSFGSRCVIIRNLPDYDIQLIKTGQFTADGVELWEESFRVSASDEGGGENQ